jgi:hypothetical protein
VLKPVVPWRKWRLLAATKSSTLSKLDEFPPSRKQRESATEAQDETFGPDREGDESGFGLCHNASNSWLFTKRSSARNPFGEADISDFELTGVLVDNGLA